MKKKNETVWNSKKSAKQIIICIAQLASLQVSVAFSCFMLFGSCSWWQGGSYMLHIVNRYYGPWSAPPKLPHPRIYFIELSSCNLLLPFCLSACTAQKGTASESRIFQSRRDINALSEKSACFKVDSSCLISFKWFAFWTNFSCRKSKYFSLLVNIC